MGSNKKCPFIFPFPSDSCHAVPEIYCAGCTTLFNLDLYLTTICLTCPDQIYAFFTTTAWFIIASTGCWHKNVGDFFVLFWSFPPSEEQDRGCLLIFFAAASVHFWVESVFSIVRANVIKKGLDESHSKLAIPRRSRLSPVHLVSASFKH